MDRLRSFGFTLSEALVVVAALWTVTAIAIQVRPPTRLSPFVATSRPQPGAHSNSARNSRATERRVREDSRRGRLPGACSSSTSMQEGKTKP
jgi:hypothetical protein